jgi:hypothetical protein
MQKYPDKEYKIYLVPKRGRTPTMKQYICIKEGSVVILTEDEISEKTRAGEFFQQYYELGREMELMIKLVPRKEAKPVKKKAEPKL